MNYLVHYMEQYPVMLKLFADDVKLYADIVNTCDADELQNALNALAAWLIAYMAALCFCAKMLCSEYWQC